MNCILESLNILKICHNQVIILMNSILKKLKINYTVWNSKVIKIGKLIVHFVNKSNAMIVQSPSQKMIKLSHSQLKNQNQNQKSLLSGKEGLRMNNRLKNYTMIGSKHIPKLKINLKQRYQPLRTTIIRVNLISHQ